MSAYLRSVLACCCLCICLVCQAGDGIFGFAAEDGTVYLSNVPDNDRYQMLIPPADVDGPGHAAGSTRRTKIGAVERDQYKALIDQTAATFGLEPALLHAVISVESGYNPAAVSKRGATGLMQIMPETAKRYGVSNLLDPAQNIEAGARYLTDLMRLFNNDMDLALAAYNAGENAVIRSGNRIPPYAETVAYVPKVVGFYKRYRSLL